MPPAVPLIAAVAGTAITSAVAASASIAALGAIGASIVSGAAGFIVSTAINQLGSRLLTKKPKTADFTQQGTSINVRSAIDTHKIIYGQVRAWGTVLHTATTDTGRSPAGDPLVNKMLHMVIVLASHEVEEIGDIYFNDQVVTIDGDGFVTSTPYGRTITANTTVSRVIETATRAAGMVTVTTTEDHDFTAGDFVTISNLGGFGSQTLDGTFAILTTPTTTTFTYAKSGPNTTSTGTGRGQPLAQKTVTTSSQASYAVVRKHLGSSTQTADEWMVSDVPGWTDAHRLRGRAYIYVRFEYSAASFPLGVPQVSAIVKGKKVYDPRTTLTTWTDNATLCVRDYIMSECGVVTTRFDDDYTTAAANICDEDVTLQDASTQNRYTCNGILDKGVSRQENLNALTASMAGAVLRIGNKVRIFAGAYDSPVETIDDDMLAGDIQIRASTPRTELINTVRGTFTDPNKGWQSTDFTPVASATFIEEDNGIEYPKDLQLPFTTSQEAAQRIAKLIMNKARQGITVTMPLKHHALEFACWDVIEHDQSYVGFSSKPFRIVRWNMPSVPNSPITVQLQEESAASYDWSAGEATVHDDPPDTNLPSPWEVQPPGVPQITEVLYATTDGSGVKSKAVITWGASQDPFVHSYQIEYGPYGASVYTIAGRTADTSLEVFDIAPGVYQFRAVAFNHLNVPSEYTSSAKTELFGLTAAPEDIENFSLNSVSDNAHLSWDQSPDLDVRIGGKIRIRYTPETGSPTWSGAIDIGPALPGIATNALLPLLDGTYLIKAVDSVGNESVNPTTIRSTIANIVKLNRVATSTQHPTFSGTKTDMEVIDGVLRLAGAALFDDGVGNFDDTPGLFDLGGGAGYEASGSYQFDSYIDVGKVTTSRVTASITADVFAEDVLFDDAPGLFDDRSGLFDGGDSSNVSVILQVRTTDDNPAGSPTWSDWRQFFVGDYTCRAYQFQVLASSTDGISNIAISALAVPVDMPDVVDSGTLTTSASGLTSITFDRTFVVTPDVGVTIQNAQTGDYEVISSLTATGMQIGVKNSSNAFVARTTSYVARAY